MRRLSSAYRLAELAAPVAAPIALIAVVVLLAQAFGSSSLQSDTVSSLITLIIVVGMYVFIGNSGVVSFGHMGFVALGAYVCALLCLPKGIFIGLLPAFPHWLAWAVGHSPNPILAGAVAGAFAAVVAVVVGVPLMRLGAFQASIATLSLMIIVTVVISNWNSVTTGTQVIVGVPAKATLWVTTLVAFGTVLVAYAYQRSSGALRLRASRDDGPAARAAGISIVRERSIAFALSAFLVGVGGAMEAFYAPITITDFYIAPTFLALAMLVIGGRNSLMGAVLGSVVISALTEGVNDLGGGVSLAGLRMSLPSGTSQLIVALAMLVMLFVRPAGLMGNREATLPVRPAPEARDPAALGHGPETTAPTEVET